MEWDSGVQQALNDRNTDRGGEGGADGDEAQHPAAGGDEPVGNDSGAENQKRGHGDVDDHQTEKVEGIAGLGTGQPDGSGSCEQQKSQHHAPALMPDEPGTNQKGGDDGDIAA